MTKKITEANVLEAYRAARQMGRAEFARELGMSKQSYSSYVNNGARQDLAGLQESATQYVGTWIGDLAVDMLIVRGAVIPCVCQTEIFDNGICPLHSHPHPTLPALIANAQSEVSKVSKGQKVKHENKSD